MKPLVVIWSDRAWEDPETIFDLIAGNSQIQAEKQVFRILDRAEQLSLQPLSGTLQPEIDPEQKARYLVQDNNKLIYFIDAERIVVDTFFDPRQIPDKLKL